jgi:threonine/homoserine/homoserine lactone efflux protein
MPGVDLGQVVQHSHHYRSLKSTISSVVFIIIGIVLILLGFLVLILLGNMTVAAVMVVIGAVLILIAWLALRSVKRRYIG